MKKILHVCISRGFFIILFFASNGLSARNHPGLKKIIEGSACPYWNDDRTENADVSIDQINPAYPGEISDTDKADTVKPIKPWTYSLAIGINPGNILELNPPTGENKISFIVNSAIDLGLNYKKEGRRFEMTNELHWIFCMQKSGLADSSHIQRVTDNLNTLHDYSIGFTKKNKWNFNLIIKTATSVFTIFKGDYFEDLNHQGRTQGFLNPYDITVSPGIKFQPDDYLRISIAPYSMQLYGLRSQEIANTGFYTKEVDSATNNYVLFLTKSLGAEINIWYDRKVGNWLEIQYRLGISSDYFDKIAKNGLMDGLFITKIRLIKNLYLSHRAILKGDLAATPFKPYYNQTIFISFEKTF